MDEGYEIRIAWSEEDGAFVAVVPELPACSAWGETYEEALAEVKVAIGLDLQTRREGGMPVPRSSGLAPTANVSTESR